MAQQVGYRINGAPASLTEFAAREGFARITLEATTALLEHVGEDPAIARRRPEKAYLITQAFRAEWLWTDVRE